MSKKILTITNKKIKFYWSMINDKWRNQFFYDALTKHAKDKVVFDLGSGTGILSFYALAAGAKFVYAIEQDKQSANITYQVLKSNFDTSRFTVINALFPEGINQSMIKQPIDILVYEGIGPGLFDEGMIQTWALIKPYLSKDAISIPDRLSCDLWVWQNAFDTDYLDTLTPYTMSHKKLSSDACIDERFFEALVKLNKKVDPKKMRWVNINALQTKPNLIYTDKVSYSMNSLPIIHRSTDPYPLNIKTDIAFGFDVDTPASVAVINKMSFESNTAFIKDAPYMIWKYNPMFNLDAPGKYRMVYINHKLESFQEEEWKVLQQVPSSIG